MMSVETVESVEPVGKYQRSVALEKPMADRLHKVCEHLGVTVGAYLKQAIGESVCRHEMTLFPKQQGQDMQAMLAKFFEEVVQSAGEESDAQPERPKRQRASKAK